MLKNRLCIAALTALLVGGGSLAVPGPVGAAPSAQAVAEASVAPALPPGGSFVPVAPQRVLDNRKQSLGRQAVFFARAAIPVPLDQVQAVVVNVTVVDAVAPGYFVLNSFNGSSAGNFGARTPSATIAVGDVASDGHAEVDTSVDAHVIVDVQGYVTTREATAGTFTPVSPRRIADSRRASGLRTFATGTTQALDVRGRAALPPDASAVVANVTVAKATADTYVTGWSGVGARPVVSIVNAARGQIVANRVLLPLATDGRAALYNAAGATDVVVDVVGYVSSAATGSYFVLSPGQRLLDTRTTAASVPATLDPAAPDGPGRAPATTDLSPTTAVWLTVVGDNPLGQGYVAVRPGDVAPGGTSDLNLVVGRTVSNAGPVAVSPTGTVAVLSSPRSRVVIDEFGWFVRARPSPPAAGVYTTRGADSPLYRSVLPASLLPSEVDGALFTGPARSGTVRDTFLRPGGTVWQKDLAEPSEPWVGDWGAASRVGSLTGITQLAGYGLSDDSAIYAREDDGRVWAYGSNRYGELGTVPTGTTETSPPRQVTLPGGAGVVGAATGVGYAVVGGTLYSWGRRSYQLGRPFTETPWIPQPVAGVSDVVAVGGDGYLTFAIDRAGRTWYWGDPLGEDPPVTAPRRLLSVVCPTAVSLASDPSGVREVCADGTAAVLGDYGELQAETLRVSGVEQITRGGYYVLRVLFDDGRVANLRRDIQHLYTEPRYEPVFDDVTAIGGTGGVQLTVVGADQ